MEEMMQEKLPSLANATPEELAHAIFDVLDAKKAQNIKVLRVNDFVSGNIPEEQMENFYDTLNTICQNLKLAEAELENELSGSLRTHKK